MKRQNANFSHSNVSEAKCFNFMILGFWDWVSQTGCFAPGFTRND